MILTNIVNDLYEKHKNKGSTAKEVFDTFLYFFNNGIELYVEKRRHKYASKEDLIAGEKLVIKTPELVKRYARMKTNAYLNETHRRGEKFYDDKEE